MPLPSNPASWTAAMDPADVVDYQMSCRGSSPLLEASESIASYTLTVLPESVAKGLTIETAGGRAASLTNGDTVHLWFSIAPEMQDDAAFDDAGTRLGVELTIVTNSTPARTRQRTWVLPVKQQ